MLENPHGLRWQWTNEGAGRVGDDASMGAEKGISMVRWTLMDKFWLPHGIYSAPELPTEQISAKGTRWPQKEPNGKVLVTNFNRSTWTLQTEAATVLIVPSWKIRSEFNSKDSKLWIPSEGCCRSHPPLSHVEGNEKWKELCSSSKGNLPSRAARWDIHLSTKFICNPPHRNFSMAISNN